MIVIGFTVVALNGLINALSRRLSSMELKVNAYVQRFSRYLTVKNRN